MMAKRVPSILPPFTKEEAQETTMIHSVAGTLPTHIALMRERPFRAPHHSTSNVALVGGALIPSQVRSLLPTMGCFSSMSYLSLHVMYWRCYVSRLRTDRLPSQGLGRRSLSRFLYAGCLDEPLSMRSL